MAHAVEKNFRIVVLGIVAFLAVTGCTMMKVSMSEREIDPWAVQELKIGETTKEAVLAEFGPPSAITVNSKGFEVYTFLSANVQSQMWRVPPILVVYVNAVSSTKVKVLTVTFSGNTVTDWNYTVNSMGGGAQAGNVGGGTIQ